MTADDWNKSLLALLIWREAEGEPIEGKIAVGWVVRNRAFHTNPPDWSGVMTKKLQFSSLTAPGDACLVKWPTAISYAWIDAMTAAEGVYTGALADPTGGATHYVNLAVAHPAWANVLQFVTKVGSHSFFREKVNVG